MNPPNHLRRRLLSILALAALLFLTACPLPAPAQIPSGYVQTTATVPALANGSFGASWTNLSSSPQLALLGCVSTFQQTVSGSFSAYGGLTVLLADTSQICPSPSTWTFNLTFACPVGTPASSFQVQVAVVGGGGTEDISSQIIAALPSTYCSGGGGGSTSYPGVTSPGTGGLAGNPGSGQTWEITPTGQIEAKQLSQILFAENFPGADWCAKVTAADTSLGSGSGEIVLSTLAGTSACAAAPTISTNHVLHILPGNYNFGANTISLPSAGGIRGSGISSTILTGSGSGDALLITGSVTILQDIKIVTTATGSSVIGLHMSGLSPQTCVYDEVHNIFIAGQATPYTGQIGLKQDGNSCVFNRYSELIIAGYDQGIYSAGDSEGNVFIDVQLNMNPVTSGASFIYESGNDEQFYGVRCSGSASPTTSCFNAQGGEAIFFGVVDAGPTAVLASGTLADNYLMGAVVGSSTLGIAMNLSGQSLRLQQPSGNSVGVNFNQLSVANWTCQNTATSGEFFCSNSNGQGFASNPLTGNFYITGAYTNVNGTLLPSTLNGYNGNASGVKVPLSLAWSTPSTLTSVCHDANGNLTDASCPGGGSGNAPNVVTITNPAQITTSTAYDPISCNTHDIDIRCFTGGVIDATTDITPAVQSCINKIDSVYGGSGTCFLPCIKANSTGPGCYLKNSSILTGPPAGSVTFKLQGGLQVGSTFLGAGWAGLLQGDGGGSPGQFQTGTVPAIIYGPTCYGTLGTAITSANTATNITPTFSGSVYGGGPSCTIANFPVGSAFTVAEIGSSTATASRCSTCTNTGLGQVTLALADPTLRIPPGSVITVTGCSTSSFNASSIAVSSSDYAAGTIVYFQTTTTATTATGCTVSGANEDKFESVRVLCSNGTAGTFNSTTYSSCGANQLTVMTKHTHLSTAAFGEVAAGPVWNTYDPQTWSDLLIEQCAGMCFFAEGSTNMTLNNIGVSATAAVTSGGMELSANYLSKIHGGFFQTTMQGVCPGGGCFQSSYPYGLLCDSAANVGSLYAYTTEACQSTVIDQGPWFYGAGIKLGDGLNQLQGFPSEISGASFEEPWNNAITIDNRKLTQNNNALKIDNSYLQDSVSDWSQALFDYTDLEAATGTVEVDNENLISSQNLCGSHFNGNLSINGIASNGILACVSPNLTSPSPTANEGGRTKTELQGIGDGFGPQVVPYGSLPMTTYTLSGIQSLCVSAGCTASAVVGPDGASGQGLAYELDTTTTGADIVTGTWTGNLYIGDVFIIFAHVRPGINQAFTIGTIVNSEGFNNAFYISGGTFPPTQNNHSLTSVCTPGAFGTQLGNDGWGAEVATCKVMAAATGATVSFHNVVVSPNGTNYGNQYFEPGWAYIPVSAALSADQIEEVRRDMYHGFVPPNSTAGHAVTGEPIDVNNPNLSSQSSLTYTTGHAPSPGSSTTASWAPDSSGNFTVSDGTGAYARPCTAGNGLCGGPVSTIVSSGAITVTAQNTYVICTTTCTVTPLAPAANVQLCVQNDIGVSSVITLAALGSGKYYGLVDHSAYGTANHTLVSGGAVGDQVCLTGKDTTHYNPWASAGTWTD